MIHEWCSGETSRQMSEFFGSPQSEKHPPQRNKGSNSKCPAYLPPLGPSARLSRRPRCIVLQPGLFTPGPGRVTQLIYGPGSQSGDGWFGKPRDGVDESARLVRLPVFPPVWPAGPRHCGAPPSFPPVIILYDLLCSKCYINLVTPHDYIPLLSSHTHTHTGLIMQTS